MFHKTNEIIDEKETLNNMHLLCIYGNNEEAIDKNTYSFLEYEDDNTYLKKYLDLKRYGLALRTKINRESKIYNDTLKTIDFKNLNFIFLYFLAFKNAADSFIYITSLLISIYSNSADTAVPLSETSCTRQRISLFDSRNKSGLTFGV